ncbi:MAG TPA: chromosome partitioning protein ParB, partial [Burkholderiaceae bacterium]
ESARQEAVDADDEDRAEALEAQGIELAEKLDELEERLLTYGLSVRSAAGAIVTLDRQGEPVIHRGLLREAEAKALRMLAKAQSGGTAENSDEEETSQSSKAGISEKLARRLSAHRTAALQIEVARNPHVALASLVHGMVQTVLQESYTHPLPIGISFRPQNQLEAHAPDYPQSPAAIALQELRQVWGERFSENDESLFAELLALPKDDLVQLLAVCVASTVDVVSSRETEAGGEVLAQAVGLDMRDWWAPTADGYFSHVSKAAILKAVQQFAPEQASRLPKLKKGDIAKEAERLVAVTGWMPAIFGVGEVGYHAAAKEAPQADAEEAVEHADEEVEALAA